MMQAKEKIALLIDADNSPASKIELIFAELAKYGVVNVRRAYGNWKSQSLKGWEEVLHEHAIRPIQQFALTKGKNATDMAMSIDAMDLLFQKNVDAFCIVSSDSDFTPLVMRILSEGCRVYGFGQQTTPTPFVNACSLFLYLEKLGDAGNKADAASIKKDGKQLIADTKLLGMLRNAVDGAKDDDGWAHLASIGHLISNQASFDPRNYGYKRLSDLFKAINVFEVEIRNSSEFFVREKKITKQRAK